MKKIIVSAILIICINDLLAQSYSGVLTHTSSYFTIHPYNASYDDGTKARLFYDGNKRRLKVWNTGGSTAWTGLETGKLIANGIISADSLGIGIGSPKALLHIVGNSVDKGDVEGSIMIGRNTGIEIQAFQDGGDPDTRGIAFRVKASATSTDNNFEAMRINSRGNLLISKTTQSSIDYKLDIDGKMRADEITVNSTGADFVFDPDYNLPQLDFIKQYVNLNKRLPGIQSASQMQKEGMAVGDLNTKLLQKIEELTLYLIEQNEINKKQAEEISQLKNQIQDIKATEGSW